MLHEFETFELHDLTKDKRNRDKSTWTGVILGRNTWSSVKESL